jgi:hypothetical protein
MAEHTVSIRNADIVDEGAHEEAQGFDDQDAPPRAELSRCDEKKQVTRWQLPLQVACPSKQTCIIWTGFVLYFLAAILLYSHLEGWDVIECIYFAVVVVTTVGYGDYLPTSDGAKIATVLLVHFALVIVAFALTDMVRLVQSAATRLMRMDESGLGIFNTEATRRRRRCRSLMAFLFYLLVLAIGTLVFALAIDWVEAGAGDGSKWLNGLYLTVITVTTIGFGDFSPAYGDHGLQIFGIFLMLIGIPATASALALFTRMVFGEINDALRLRVIQGRMTSKKFDGVNEFVREMRENGVGNYRHQGDDLISRFEYLCFVLVENGVVELRNIQNVMKNFDEIDHDGAGFIARTDVVKSGSHQSFQDPQLIRSENTASKMEI